ncbi:uracil-DNA glycosylase-like [Haliotis rufescens]|uniref:uracil-DNA glycosylase-like n=1 Tax=Haliotis rufescens TaxID=6454 RepID=UPI001EB00E08|nr:uracil-DNA glycosylase-like [Haliotis rufescens]
MQYLRRFGSESTFRVYSCWPLDSAFNLQISGMIGQAKISSFFSPKNAKRSADTAIDQNTPPKKNKPDSIPAGKEEVSPSSQTLSPDQHKKIEENRITALAKIHAKKTSGLVVNVGKTWLKALEPEFSKTYFLELSEFVQKERSKSTIYPPVDQVFSWTQTSDIDQVKVVILGQDPYHGPKQAHGLCFSVQQGVQPPPSLVNMYKELAKDIDGFEQPGHGTLNGWARQGVLLLNACLTVRAHNANSHAGKGWEKFTDAVISWLNKNGEGIVFMLWGAYAQKKGACIDKKRHHILKAVHPSPLSAHRGFFGCKHFSQCNSLLKQQGKTPIDWGRLPRV